MNRKVDPATDSLKKQSATTWRAMLDISHSDPLIRRRKCLFACVCVGRVFDQTSRGQCEGRRVLGLLQCSWDLTRVRERVGEGLVDLII